MSARRNPDHAAKAVRRDLTAVVLVGFLFAGAGGYGLRVLHERDRPAGAYTVVPSTVATTPVDRVERTAVCRCAGRGDR